MNNLDNTIEILTKSQDQSKYYTVLTLVGLNKIESYYQANKTVTLTHMGFGGLRDTYVEPSESATTVPNQWAVLPLERKPADGLLGGGATISNKEEFKGNFIGNVGIYDEDGTLILIASYPLTELAPDASIVSAFPIDIEVYLSNASNVTVETDTNITHPTHDEFHTAIEKLSRYATTEHKGLVELATIEEVNESTNPQLAVTPKTLDKAGLIRQLEEFATQKADDVKQFILGGVPSSSLDTILEIDKALQQTGDAIRAVYDTIATKLSITAFEQYKTDIDNKLSVINQNIANLAPRVTVFNGRHATFTIPNIKGSVVTFTLQSQRDSNINNPKLGSTAECTFILIGSNQIERIGYWFVQQSRTQFSEFIVSAEILRNNVIFTVEEQFYNTNSSHEPTTPSFTSTACHFKDIVVRV